MLRAAALLVFAPAAIAQSNAGSPLATQPTTQPDITVTVSSTAPTGKPTAPPAMAERIVIEEVEQTVLDATRDGSGQADETGLYASLSIAARARENVQLDRDEWQHLDRPAYRSLLAQPKRWRAQPIQLAVRIYEIWKLKPGDGLNYSRFWPKDRPVWRIHGTVLGNKDEESQPITIFSVVNPDEYLGQGEATKEDNLTQFKHGPILRLAAIFYKVLADTDKEGNRRLYPVVMSWQLADSEGDTYAATPGADSGLWGSAAMPVVLLVAVLAVFYLVRRQVTRTQNKIPKGPEYKPLREGADKDDDKEKKDTQSPADRYVDPDLAKAVEQFRHEKGIE